MAAVPPRARGQTPLTRMKGLSIGKTLGVWLPVPRDRRPELRRVVMGREHSAINDSHRPETSALAVCAGSLTGWKWWQLAAWAGSGQPTGGRRRRWKWIELRVGRRKWIEFGAGGRKWIELGAGGRKWIEFGVGGRKWIEFGVSRWTLRLKVGRRQWRWIESVRGQQVDARFRGGRHTPPEPRPVPLAPSAGVSREARGSGSGVTGGAGLNSLPDLEPIGDGDSSLTTQPNSAASPGGPSDGGLAQGGQFQNPGPGQIGIGAATRVGSGSAPSIAGLRAPRLVAGSFVPSAAIPQRAVCRKKGATRRPILTQANRPAHLGARRGQMDRAGAAVWPRTKARPASQPADRSFQVRRLHRASFQRQAAVRRFRAGVRHAAHLQLNGFIDQFAGRYSDELVVDQPEQLDVVLVQSRFRAG